jgi:AraC family transcriptional regulator of adaptative response/methylated-DNA-[protein]-cysteine methyltransferase
MPERWQALLERARQADGAFVYGVVTTGVYCRPHCASRRPNRGNVRFFDSWEAAEKAGFRPCKRCAPSAPAAPDQARGAVVRACALMDEAERAPSLTELAEAVGLSPSHFQRLFTKTVGVSPKQYAMQKRLGRVRDSLRSEATVAAAVHAAGFESGSRFYEAAADSLGMTPSQFRQGGEGATVSYAIAGPGWGSRSSPPRTWASAGSTSGRAPKNS